MLDDRPAGTATPLDSTNFSWRIMLGEREKHLRFRGLMTVISQPNMTASVSLARRDLWSTFGHLSRSSPVALRSATPTETWCAPADEVDVRRCRRWARSASRALPGGFIALPDGFQSGLAQCFQSCQSVQFGLVRYTALLARLQSPHDLLESLRILVQLLEFLAITLR
ncbi:hypothetical protein A5N72_17105 [Prescottella equi]|nr:hypothetical protein A5N72_17105 [Prescottella equi]